MQMINLEEMTDSPEAQKLLAIRRANAEQRRHDQKMGEAQVFNLDDFRKKKNRTPEEDKYLALVDDAQAEQKKAKQIRERIRNLKIESGEAEVKPSKK